ncbi:hypothetical protein [Azonexus sp.]|uniref:hypothetical protein n=1 Tax=Azonexus sp. TaxID=1872668 RepID=UPI0035AE13A3
MSIELAERAAAGKLDPEVIAWLSSGLRAYIDGRERSLETALSLDLSRRVRERNDALIEAAKILSRQSTSPWATAGLLARAICNFETNVLPSDQLRNSKNMTALNTHLLRAFNTGVRIPRTQRKIYDLIR